MANPNIPVFEEKQLHLEDILFRLSKYYADQKTISEKLRNAVIYPTVMLILIIVVLVIMLTRIVTPSWVQSGLVEELTMKRSAAAIR